MRGDWEKDLCLAIDSARSKKTELEYYASVEQLVEMVEDLCLIAYTKGKAAAKETEKREASNARRND